MTTTIGRQPPIIWGLMGSPDSVAIREGNFHGNGIFFDSFDTNAVGMLNLLEAARQAVQEPIHSPKN